MTSDLVRINNLDSTIAQHVCFIIQTSWYKVTLNSPKDVHSFTESLIVVNNTFLGNPATNPL